MDYSSRLITFSSVLCHAWIQETLHEICIRLSLYSEAPHCEDTDAHKLLISIKVEPCTQGRWIHGRIEYRINSPRKCKSIFAFFYHFLRLRWYSWWKLFLAEDKKVFIQHCQHHGDWCPDDVTGIIMCLCPANKRPLYSVTSSLIGWCIKNIIPDARSSMRKDFNYLLHSRVEKC